MQSWFAEAKELPSLQVDIFFQIHERFFYGPDRISDISDFERLTEELTPPGIRSAMSSLVSTSEAFGHERELALYYQQIIRMARKHGRPITSVHNNFWLRLRFWNGEHETHISFPWYDSLREIDSFLETLVLTDSGLVHHDIEQGWELETYAFCGLLYFMGRDPDAGTTHCVIAVPRDDVVAQVKEVRWRANAIIEYLSKALGADVWTDHVRTEPAFKLEPL